LAPHMLLDFQRIAYNWFASSKSVEKNPKLRQNFYERVIILLFLSEIKAKIS
jgi:hypothetical protein